MMDHPGIAKVLDGGATESGRPYFVMELVRGDPVTAYCDRNNLGTRDRLSLFREICHAVQHAHQKGVIHRDLKPSNVLVTVADGRAMPKVIDFGIAKATHARLTEKTLFTEFRQLIGTPEYMSPEQAEMSGVDIDTRSDIYSLGVLLYELLTGTTPFAGRDLRSAAFGEIQRIIREEQPEKPSTRLSSLTVGSGADEDDTSAEAIARHRHTDVRSLTRTLRGDLDWIVMKCLEKDRTRRYETANGVALDIERYLSQEPVLAGPPSASYRVRKFVRRNRVPVAVAASMVVLVLGGITGTSVGLVWALREAEAARVAESAESVARGEAQANAERASAEAAEASRQRSIAEAVNRFLTGDLLSAVAPSTRAGRGRDVLMREVLDEAAKRIDAASRPGGRFADAPVVEAAIRETLSDTYWYLGKYDAARPHAERALAVRRRELGDEHPATLASMVDLANVVAAQGHEKEAGRLYEEALEIRRRVLGEDDPNTLTSLHNLAVSYKVQGRIAEAEPLFVDTLERRLEVLGEEHSDTLMTMDALAGLRMDDFRYDEAGPLLERARTVAQHALGEEHAETLRITDNLAILRHRQGRTDEAETLFRHVLEIRRRVYGPEHPVTLKTMRGLANVLASERQYQEAERLYRGLVDASRRVLGDEHPATTANMLGLAAVLLDRGKMLEAEQVERDILEIYRRQHGVAHPDTLTAMNNLAVTCVNLDKHDEAEDLYRQVLAGRRSILGDGHALVAMTYGNLGRLLYYRGPDRLEEAIELLERGVSGMKSTIGIEQLQTRNTMRWLMEAYMAAGRRDDTVSMRREMLEYMVGAAQAPDATHNILSGTAWELLTVEEELRDPVLAMTLARRAVEMTSYEDPNPLDTYALALFENGQEEEALQTQRRALELLPQDHPSRDHYVSQLRKYEAALGVQGEPSGGTP
ncbi:MAG: tetratricopeptide repeat protein [Planctomycetota bacterium]|jgi:tetratricopeptide (TPR) repeat protein